MTASPNYKCHGLPGTLSSFIVPGNHIVYISPCLLNAGAIGQVRIEILIVHLFLDKPFAENTVHIQSTS